MKSIEISGELRQSVGKKDAKKLRAKGCVPAVLYGGEANVHFSVRENDLRHLIYTPNVYTIELTLGDKNYQAILKDVQFHPVSDKILHVDLLEINLDKEVTIEVPVHLHGLPKGVQAGGQLNLLQRKLRLKALGKYLPDNLDIDVSEMKIGDTFKIKDLSFENIDLLNAPNSVVCSVRTTRLARGMEDESAENEEAEGTEGTEESSEE